MIQPLVVVGRPCPGTLAVHGAEVRVAPPSIPRPDLLALVRGATAVITMVDQRVDDEFLNAAGPDLRGVCNYAVGTDNIQLDRCAARGIAVTNTPDAVTEGTANLAMGLLLAAARHIATGDRFVRAGRFEREGTGFPNAWLGAHLTGQTLLIVGAGRIGRAVALRAQAFGMRTLYTARSQHLDFELAPLAARRVELDEGLKIADVVSIHTPLTPETRGLFDARRIALMKPTAILINTARGPIVDEGTLAAALANGHLFAAGLDVFEQEPKVHPALLALDNVVMTPHIGSGERKYRELMTAMACANAAAIVAGREPPNRVR